MAGLFQTQRGKKRCARRWRRYQAKTISRNDAKAAKAYSTTSLRKGASASPTSCSFQRYNADPGGRRNLPRTPAPGPTRDSHSAPRMRARASPSRAASRGSRVPAAAEHRRSEFSMRRSAETGHSPELVIPGSGSQYERQSSRLIYSKLMLTTSKWNRSGGRALTGDALMEAQVL
jgi:hypothetical protein